MVGKVLAEADKNQLGQDDALLLMRAAVILRKCCLQKQEPFTGSFPSDLTSPVSGHLRSFLNILCRAPQSSENRTMRSNHSHKAGQGLQVSLASRSSTTSAVVLIIPLSPVTSGTTKSMRHPLYMGLKLHGDGRQKKQISFGLLLWAFLSHTIGLWR